MAATSNLLPVRAITAWPNGYLLSEVATIPFQCEADTTCTYHPNEGPRHRTACTSPVPDLDHQAGVVACAPLVDGVQGAHLHAFVEAA